MRRLRRRAAGSARWRAAEAAERGEAFSDALAVHRVDSCYGTLDAVVHVDGASPASAYDALVQQKVEIVLTAHPTEVHRRALLAKHQSVTSLLEKRDALDFAAAADPDGAAAAGLSGDGATYERAQLERALRREVAGMWSSDELRRAKPTPQKEARDGLHVLETSLWSAVPGFVRRLDSVVRAQCGRALPLDSAPVVFASWMGGDRDGNPNVTARVTREVVAAQRRRAAALYVPELDALALELSVREASDATRALAESMVPAGDGEASESPEGAAARALALAGARREPYSAISHRLADRLRASARWAEQLLPAGADAADFAAGEIDDLPIDAGHGAGAEGSEPLLDAAELMAPLRAMHESLVENGHAELADGRLADLVRRVAAFGLQLAPLDLRQESTLHLKAVGALCALARGPDGKPLHGGADGYAGLPEADKIAWLAAELATGRPLLRRGALDDVDALGIEDPVVRDVLETAKLAAELPVGALGAYVISQATHASDVLAVELLLAEAGARAPPRVVPLFETLDDLDGAADTLRALFASPGYAERTGRRQEVMVGYSDSAKDAGRLAAVWAQFEAQERMLAVARESGFEITFFHGKGGTVARGGNPAMYEAVLAHPPGTIDGRFRVTEQGEMIAQNFGDAAIAERSLDIFTAAVLRDRFVRRPTPTPAWREAMAALSRVSCDAYRAVVRGEPRFVPYFRKATPELELGALNVGSRPAKRNPSGGVESLRAIPWIFAWSQTRLNLPAWLGIGDALAGAAPPAQPEGGAPAPPVDGATLRDMYARWPWFKTNIDLIEMLLSKSETAISAHYEAALVGARGDGPETDELVALGEAIRDDLARTERAVLAVSGSAAVAANNHLLQRSLRLRNPYVDVLNVLQAEALCRLRADDDAKAAATAGTAGAAAALDDDERAALQDALLVTINGIAAGLRNSG